jgi:hypothetical protein
MTIIPCTIPPVKQWVEIHWTTRVTEVTLEDYMAKAGLEAEIVYRLPSGSFTVPVQEEL